ncbi:MAG: hypothetical protein ACJASY_003569 [Halioglobus sp.]|jgi:hypothetical protein
MDGLSDPTITDAYGNKKAPVEGIGRINTLIFPIYIKKQAIGNWLIGCTIIERKLMVR